MKAVRTCHECRARFEGESWQRKCWRCWRKEKDRQPDRDAYERGYRDGLVAGEPLARASCQLLTDAIALTHPDRHPSERHELATRTTAALLELRVALAA